MNNISRLKSLALHQNADLLIQFAVPKRAFVASYNSNVLYKKQQLLTRTQNSYTISKINLLEPNIRVSQSIKSKNKIKFK